MAASDRTLQILPGGQSSAPFTYTIPASTSFDLIAVRATFDGTGSAGAYLPCVQIISDAGVLMAQTVGSSVATGGSVDATFFPWVKTAGTVAPGGISYDNLILSLDVRAFYKLNETSGTTAHDSSGNGFDATVPAGLWSAPTWGEAAGPPGTTSALFNPSGPPTRMFNAAFPALSSPITACAWVKRADNLLTLAVGEGDPLSTGNGWAIGVLPFNNVPPNRATVLNGNGGGAGELDGDNAIAVNVWHFIAAVRSGTTWTLYVDGVAQSTTLTHAIATAAGLWMGVGTGGTLTTNAYLSYVMVFDSALNQTAISALAGTL